LPSPVGNTLVAVAGGVAAAVGSALCCVGPLVAVFFGLSGAGLAAMFEPLRPYLLGATALALGSGFVIVHHEDRKACEPGTPCASPRARRRMKWALWIATAIAIPLVTFPWWSTFVLG
jgi:mercuric ion transport protein